jgi:DNA-3-methyladenine glycosylase II
MSEANLRSCAGRGADGSGEARRQRHPLDQATLAAGIDELARVDADVARALARIGYPPPRQRPAGFATLLQVMNAQQLSTRSAAAIWGRLEAALATGVTAAGLLAIDDAALKAIGFSRQKMKYGRALAQAVAEGRLDLDMLAHCPEDEAIAAISALHGFGRWSAEVYLLFALGRADVWPADDLGLQIGMQRLKRLEMRPKRRLMDELGEPWRPWRGAGAIFLWHVYGAATLDDATPAPPA